MENEIETNQKMKEIERLELKNKTDTIELFVRSNPNISDEQLRQYFNQNKDCREIFSCADAFVAFSRHLPTK